MSKVRDLLAGAFASVGPRGSAATRTQWERHIRDAFGAFFGGTAANETGAIEEAHLLAIAVTRSVVFLGVFDASCFLGDDVSMPANNAILLRFTAGSGDAAEEPLEELARRVTGLDVIHLEHHRIIAMLKTGMLECMLLPGFSEGMRSTIMQVQAGLEDGSYSELRCYDGLAELFNGLYGIVTTLISPHEEDWDLLLQATDLPI